MAAAVAENAESLDDLQSDRARLIEKLKTEAAAFFEAQEDARIDLMIDLDDIQTTALERDRFGLDRNLDNEEMRELKVSLKARGLQQSIKVFQDPEGGYQLESGWRRLTAYRQLLAETGERRSGNRRCVPEVCGQLQDTAGRW